MRILIFYIQNIFVWPLKGPVWKERLKSSLVLLLGKESSVDAGEDTALRDGDSSKDLRELLIVSDSKLNVSGVDARLFVVPGRVTSELADLGGEILEDGG